MERDWSFGERDTVLGALERATAAAPATTFARFENASLTYEEAWDRAGRLAAGLRDLGVGPGDTVVSMLDNGPTALLIWFAVNFLGATHVPINTALRGEFLSH